jgi:hypothetical protein
VNVLAALKLRAMGLSSGEAVVVAAAGMYCRDGLHQTEIVDRSGISPAIAVNDPQAARTWLHPMPRNAAAVARLVPRHRAMFARAAAPRSPPVT